MPKHNIHVEATVDVSPERVFDVFADHRRFGKLLGVPVKKVDPAPTPDEPNGIGSVRHIGVGPVSFQEKVVSFERPELIEYKVIKGGPIKNHHGRIEFKPVVGGCHVSYSIEFDGKLPLTGAPIAVALKQALEKAMKKLPEVA